MVCWHTYIRTHTHTHQDRQTHWKQYQLLLSRLVSIYNVDATSITQPTTLNYWRNKYIAIMQEYYYRNTNNKLYCFDHLWNTCVFTIHCIIFLRFLYEVVVYFHKFRPDWTYVCRDSFVILHSSNHSNDLKDKQRTSASDTM